MYGICKIWVQISLKTTLPGQMLLPGLQKNWFGNLIAFGFVLFFALPCKASLPVATYSGTA